MLSDLAPYFKLMADPLLQVKTLDFLTEETVMVGYSAATEECEEALANTNIAIAAFTTAQTRFKLYE